VIIANRFPYNDPNLDLLISQNTYSLCVADYVFRVIRIILDIYIVVTFADLSREFLKIKLNIDNRLTKFNYFVIYSVFVLIILNFIQTLSYLLKNIYMRYQTTMGLISFSY
jgi:hypothetical protein